MCAHGCVRDGVRAARTPYYYASLLLLPLVLVLAGATPGVCVVKGKQLFMSAGVLALLLPFVEPSLGEESGDNLAPSKTFFGQSSSSAQNLFAAKRFSVTKDFFRQTFFSHS